MKNHAVRLLSVSLVLGLTLILAGACAKQEQATQEMEMAAEEAPSETSEVEIPDAVRAAYLPHFPDAEIAKVEVEEKGDIVLFDIEFEGDRGEIEVTSDGIIIDIASVITEADLPPAAAETIGKAIEGATVTRYERSEIRSELQETNGVFTVVQLAEYRYVYEAEIEKGDQTGEIAVDADGNVVEPLKWE